MLHNSLSKGLFGTFFDIARHGHTILNLKNIFAIPIWASTLKGWWYISLFIDALFIRYLEL